MKPVDESVLLDASGAVLRADEDDEGDDEPPAHGVATARCSADERMRHRMARRLVLHGR